jgi:hypothetical protein
VSENHAGIIVSDGTAMSDIITHQRHHRKSVWHIIPVDEEIEVSDSDGG